MVSVSVRHAEPHDAKAVHSILAGPRRARYSCRSSRWRPSAGKFFSDAREGGYDLVACVEGEVVGHLRLEAYVRLRRRHAGKIGVVVRDDWQGRGMGTALMRAALDLADDWLGLTRVELVVYADNAPGVALYEKFGFEVEGTHRRYAFRDGGYVDAYAMARLR